MTIRQLPPEVADAIAAGEVVERPASVVKELVENSLDAGARRITVEIRGAGRSLVRVADDGDGMAPEELPLAFRRHATSKVSSLDDLQAIASLGFRGEALASIAAVADVECQTRRGRIRVRAGQVLEQGGAAAAGTVVEVRDLFANTPARLKFLKSEATEAAACQRVVQAYALLYPAVRFQVTVDARNVLTTQGDGDLRQALAAVHGKSVAAEMVAAAYANEGQPAVSGFVSQPRLSRGNRDGVLLAVNGRPVASRALAFALEECYSGSLERGRHPVAVLEVRVDPELVDVNVHPAKREVRFREEGAVFTALQRAVRAALSGAEAYRLPLAAPVPASAEQPALAGLPEVHTALAPIAVLPETQPAAGVLRPLGQVLDGYLVAEGPEGVVLVDQHAAHERILYNRFLRQLAGRPPVTQPLLLPLTLELGAGQLAAASDHVSELHALGFELQEFGPRSLRVLAAPAETPSGRVPEAVEDLLNTLAEARSGDAREKAAASLACHSAVRFGDQLDAAEQRRLLEELEAADNSVTCPHGRPTRLVVDWQDLKRHFRRNY